MKYKEEIIKSETIYKGRIFDVIVDDVKLPDGKIAKREIVDHWGAVTIIAVTNDNKVILVKQYRHPVKKELYELPAGKLDLNLDPLSTAKQELREETGYEAKVLKDVIQCYTTPGFSNERMHFFVAKDLTKTKQNLDHDEFIDVLEVDSRSVIEMIKEGKIEDVKSLLGIYYLLINNIIVF